MKTTNEKLENFESFTYSVPCYKVTDYTKKELTAIECCYLRYCLMQFVFKNRQHIYDFRDVENEKTIFNDVDRGTIICNESLYAGDSCFRTIHSRGYRISDNEYIEYIELTIENRVVLNIYNNTTGRSTTYLID